MGTLPAKVIYCPKHEDHPRKKILLLLGNNELYIHCHDHKWIKIELSKAGKQLNFDDTAVAVTAIGETHFDLERVPSIAIGDFQSKFKSRKGKHAKYQ